MQISLFGHTFGIGRIPEKKYNSVAPIIYMAYANNSRGVWTKRNYAQYADNGYKRNPIVFKCVNMLARACASIPLKVMVGDTEAPDSHPLRKLFARPNSLQSWTTVRQNFIAFEVLEGNGYMEGVSVNGNPFPTELWVHRPDRMRVLPSQYGPGGYVYDFNGQIKSWARDPITGASEIMHCLFFNPLDDWYGQAAMEAGQFSVDGHNGAGEWNQGLMQNGCRPSGALVYKPDMGAPPNLSEQQKDSLREQLNSTYGGTRNAGRPLLLDGNLTWQAMSLTPTEMDWANGKDNCAREICTVFDVPPMIVGIKDSSQTYANYSEARQSFFQDTVIPLNEAFVDALNSWLLPAFENDKLKIVQDVSALPALAGLRNERWQQVSAATFLTTNERRLACGYDKVEDPAADEILITSLMTPLSQVNDPPDNSELLDPDGTGQGENDDGEQVDEDGNAIEDDDADDAPPKKPAIGKPGAKPPANGKPKKPFPPKKPTKAQLAGATVRHVFTDPMLFKLACALRRESKEYATKLEAKAADLVNKPPKGSVDVKDKELCGRFDNMQVFLVDGAEVRAQLVDFVGGGNPMAYPSMPAGQIWVERTADPDDNAAIVVHELVEYLLMKYGKEAYQSAHDRANQAEKIVRCIASGTHHG